MNRKACLAMCSLVALVFLAGCQPAAPDTNRSATTATPETVDTAAIETELLRIENDFPRVIREKDGAAVRRVLADEVVLVYPDGTTGGKAQDIKDIESGALTAESIEMVEVKVNVLDTDAAVVTGRIILKNGKFKVSEVRTIDTSGQYRFVDTFARRNGEWKLIAGATVPIREPLPAASPTASPAAKASPAASPTASPAARTSPSPGTTP